jgi:hypothetical protein
MLAVHLASSLGLEVSRSARQHCDQEHSAKGGPLLRAAAITAYWKCRTASIIFWALYGFGTNRLPNGISSFEARRIFCRSKVESGSVDGSHIDSQLPINRTKQKKWLLSQANM